MWNTGCNRISNRLNAPIYLIDSEDSSLRIQVDAGAVNNWKCVIFPWCVNNWEIEHKAFRVANLNTGRVQIQYGHH